MLKRTLQDTFAEGSAKENQILERLGTQKHERAIGELELKRRKMEHKAMEKQHQREREREEHEFRMLRMRLMITQNQQTALGMQVPGMQVPGMQVPGMQAPPQSSLNGFGLMSELTLPESSSSLSTPYSI
jgi:CO dehydrogenase/acetyl-CoA synthase beta subunit